MQYLRKRRHNFLHIIFAITPVPKVDFLLGRIFWEVSIMLDKKFIPDKKAIKLVWSWNFLAWNRDNGDSYIEIFVNWQLQSNEYS